LSCTARVLCVLSSSWPWSGSCPRGSVLQSRRQRLHHAVTPWKEPELMKGWSMKDMLAGQMCKKESYGGEGLRTGPTCMGIWARGSFLPRALSVRSSSCCRVGLGLKMKKTGGVVVTIFGDGASNRVTFMKGSTWLRRCVAGDIPSRQQRMGHLCPP